MWHAVVAVGWRQHFADLRILMMFSVAFGFALSVFQDGTVSVSIWHLVLPLMPTAVGLALLLAAPRGEDGR